MEDLGPAGALATVVPTSSKGKKEKATAKAKARAKARAARKRESRKGDLARKAREQEKKTARGKARRLLAGLSAKELQRRRAKGQAKDKRKAEVDAAVTQVLRATRRKGATQPLPHAQQADERKGPPEGEAKGTDAAEARELLREVGILGLCAKADRQKAAAAEAAAAQDAKAATAALRRATAKAQEQAAKTRAAARQAEKGARELGRWSEDLPQALDGWLGEAGVAQQPPLPPPAAPAPGQPEDQAAGSAGAKEGPLAPEGPADAPGEKAQAAGAGHDLPAGCAEAAGLQGAKKGEGAGAQVHSLVRLSSDAHEPKSDWGDWGRVRSVDKTGWLNFQSYYTVRKGGRDRAVRARVADVSLLQQEPQEGGPARKPLTWLAAPQAKVVKEVWVWDPPARAREVRENTWLSTAEVDLGGFEVLWRLTPPDVVWVPSQLIGFPVAEMQAGCLSREGAGLLDNCLALAERARCLVVPVWASGHWTCLVLERGPASWEALRAAAAGQGPEAGAARPRAPLLYQKGSCPCCRNTRCASCDEDLYWSKGDRQAEEGKVVRHEGKGS